MENQNQMQNQYAAGMPNQQPTSKNHGGHELFDVHETIGGIICMLDQYQLYGQHIQDPELKSILQHQSAFVTQLYNTAVESFKTGQKPSVSTQVYKMEQSNDVTYGMSPGQPKKPNQSVGELNDQQLSSFMLGHTKSLASLMTMSALEVTNPVLRRVFADSVPNMVEMGYEIFLYQNKHGYYQVPQLMEQDMAQMLNSFAPAPTQGNMAH